VLVKEPGTASRPPGIKTRLTTSLKARRWFSFWVPLDPVEEASLRLVRGSHLWEKPLLSDQMALHEDNFLSRRWHLPALCRILIRTRLNSKWVWNGPMASPATPGGVSLPKTLHGARGNLAARRRRRVLTQAARRCDCAVYRASRKTSPPFPGHGMVPGQQLREIVSVLSK